VEPAGPHDRTPKQDTRKPNPQINSSVHGLLTLPLSVEYVKKCKVPNCSIIVLVLRKVGSIPKRYEKTTFYCFCEEIPTNSMVRRK
jgi:hypothetical protein